jgi:hypothetical protein
MSYSKISGVFLCFLQDKRGTLQNFYSFFFFFFGGGKTTLQS